MTAALLIVFRGDEQQIITCVKKRRRAKPLIGCRPTVVANVGVEHVFERCPLHFVHLNPNKRKMFHDKCHWWS